MAMSVGFSREVYVYIKLANIAYAQGVVQTSCNDEDARMEQISRVEILKDVEKKLQRIKKKKL